MIVWNPFGTYDPEMTVRRCVDAISADVGRLRKRATNPYNRHLLDRIADHADGIDSATTPTAAELYRLYLADCSEDVAVTRALADVDARVRHLRELRGDEDR